MSVELFVRRTNDMFSSMQLNSTSDRSSITEGLLTSESLMKSNIYKLGFELNDDFLLSSASTNDDSLELIEIEVRE